MRHGSNFNPEWGYIAPAPGFLQTARLIVIAVIIGATAGAAIVFSVLDRQRADGSVAARTLVAPDVSRPVTGGTSLAAQRRAEPQQTKSTAEAQNSAEQKTSPELATGAKTRPQQNELATTSTSQRPTGAAIVAEAPALKDEPSLSDTLAVSPDHIPPPKPRSKKPGMTWRTAPRSGTPRYGGPRYYTRGYDGPRYRYGPQYGYEPSYGFERGFAWAP